MSPKKQAQLSHKIAVLSSLLVEGLDEINADSKMALEVKEKALEIIPFCEKILNDVYAINQIKNSTYLTDLSNKVDTVIRKNFETITA